MSVPAVSPASLPLRLELYPDELRAQVLAAITAVVEMEPLPRGKHAHDRRGTHGLPTSLPRLIALHGAARCGKTSLADFVQDHYADVAQLGFSEPMIVEVNSLLAPYGHVIDDANKADPRYRFLLQMWAQARRLEDPEYWVGPLARACRRALDSGARLVLMPGLREPLEKETIESLGGEVWKIVNPNLPVEDPERLHPIERALAHLPDQAFARVVVNDAPSLLDWCRKVEALVESFR